MPFQDTLGWKRARDFQIAGECMIGIRLPEHYINSELRTTFNFGVSELMSGRSTVYELGMAQENITIIPRFSHTDVRADDFSLEGPPDTFWSLGDAEIRMVLWNYRPNMLDICMAEAMAGSIGPDGAGGLLTGLGTPMGGGKPIYASGCHYIGLNIFPALDTTEEFVNRSKVPWRFPAAYLSRRPVEYPMGTKPTAVYTTWRAIPYVDINAANVPGPITKDYVKSQNAVLWDHSNDT